MLNESVTKILLSIQCITKHFPSARSHDQELKVSLAEHSDQSYQTFQSKKSISEGAETSAYLLVCSKVCGERSFQTFSIVGKYVCFLVIHFVDIFCVCFHKIRNLCFYFCVIAQSSDLFA